MEHKLLKQGDISSYNEELWKAVRKGYLKKLGDEDLVSCQGPISNVAHHPVYKEPNSTLIRQLQIQA